MCYNIAVIQFVKDLKFPLKIKHIKQHSYFLRGAKETKEVVIKYISTYKMIIDLLTKPILRDVFKTQMMSRGLCRVQFLDVSYYVMNMFFCNEHLCNKD